MENYFKFLLGTLVLLLLLITVQDAYVDPPPPPPPPPSPIYTGSAHGNSAYGVDRTSLSTFGYSKGNCAHCHEQHASIGGSEPNPTGGPSKFCLLADNFSGVTSKPYSQSDSACFFCHIVTGTLQSPSFSNYSYSYTFGGCLVGDCPTSNIFDAFNGVSYHNLNDILNFAKATWSSTYTADSNPCSACHNIHIAQRSCGKPSGSFDTTKSAISRPSEHGNLWGDDEKMSNYTANYQAPYRFGGVASGYEPDGSATQDGSNLPDYATFCIDCHTSTANSVWSTTLSRWLRPIDWNIEKHGKGISDGWDGAAYILSPYTAINKVLACTDCHEPHGAPNVVLIRKEVNGGVLSGQITPNYTTIVNRELSYLCMRCHKMSAHPSYPFNLAHHNNFNPCVNYCHGVVPGDFVGQTCSYCHFHGSAVNGYRTF